MPASRNRGNTPKWSPGEWLVDTVGAYRFIHDEAGRLIANFAAAPGITPQRRTANATLTAAAPELYAALDKYVEHFGDPLKVARAALAKATGGTAKPDDPLSMAAKREAVESLMLETLDEMIARHMRITDTGGTDGQ